MFGIATSGFQTRSNLTCYARKKIFEISISMFSHSSGVLSLVRLSLLKGFQSEALALAHAKGVQLSSRLVIEMASHLLSLHFN